MGSAPKPVIPGGRANGETRHNRHLIFNVKYVLIFPGKIVKFFIKRQQSMKQVFFIPGRSTIRPPADHPFHFRDAPGRPKAPQGF